MPRKLHVVVLEPYYGGSHAAFVETFAARTRHDCTLARLPARKWKWRMRGAGAWFARDGGSWMVDGGAVDVILCNDMLSVTDLKALLPMGIRDVPLACYFHENQLTYPIPMEQERDYQYGMTNILSCLAADAIWFNSRFHLEDFLAAGGVLLDKMPDHVPRDVMRDIRAKATVLYPPVAVDATAVTRRSRRERFTILWCHRWEYDKNPEPFFDALIRLDQAGYDFNLVFLGEQFRAAPPVFADSWDSLRRHILHAGYLPNRGDYLEMLSRCDLVVSTAIQENFGIAVIEAILAGCQPLLPNRLAYPEVIPKGFHETCLYDSDSDLFHRLRSLLEGNGWLDTAAREELVSSTERRFGAKRAVSALDNALDALASEA